MSTATFDKATAARSIRDAAATLEDDEDVTLVQTVADYVESTASEDRTLLAEVAMAYVEGYQHATGNNPRGVWTILRRVGLTR